MKNKFKLLLYFILLSIFTSCIFDRNRTKGFCLSVNINEKHFNTPEECIQLMQKFINNNDLYGYISLFPLKELSNNIQMADIINYTNTYSNVGSLYYSPIFDKSRLNTIINNNSTFFIMLKMELAKMYYSDFEKPDLFIIIKKQKNFRNDLKSYYKNKKKIIVLIKITSDDGTLISDNGAIRIEEINGKWRLTNAFLN